MVSKCLVQLTTAVTNYCVAWEWRWRAAPCCRRCQLFWDTANRRIVAHVAWRVMTWSSAISILRTRDWTMLRSASLKKVIFSPRLLPARRRTPETTFAWSLIGAVSTALFSGHARCESATSRPASATRRHLPSWDVCARMVSKCLVQLTTAVWLCV
jgi:hypothetical protein